MVGFRQRRSVAIIGGGFAGMMVAAHLIKEGEVPLQICLWEPRLAVGEGVAYGTKEGCHWLNVKAAKMGAWAEDEQHFYRWLEEREEYWREELREEGLVVAKDAYVPRRLYGLYLQSIWREVQTLAEAKGIRLLVQHEMAVDWEERSFGRIEVVGESGERCEADVVVLAVGVAPTKSWRGLPLEVITSGHYIAEPWPLSPILSMLAGQKGRLVLLGTGLTMADVAVSSLLSSFEGEIVAISHSGRLSQPHVGEKGHSLGCSLETQSWPPLVSEIVRRLRLCVEAGEDWRAVMDALRQDTVRLWSHLSIKERCIFLRHGLGLWNRHRHRLPWLTWQTLAEGQRTGRLRLCPGSIEGVSRVEKGGLVVSYHSPLESKKIEVEADFVINCLGPEYKVNRWGGTLLSNLLRRGWIKEDELGIGLRVSTGYRLMGSAPCPVYGVGALLFGTYLETTAVPEIRQQCALIAKNILNQD